MPSILSEMSEHELWNTAKNELRKNITSEMFAAWFECMECVSQSEDEVVLKTNSDFAVMWISDNYLDLLKNYLSLAAGRNMSVKLIAAAPEDSSEPSSAPTPSQIDAIVPTARKTKVEPPAIDARNTFENFVVGESNQFAHTAAFAVAKAPGKAYNPLLIYGASGTGKTHLMHAIAHFIFHDDPSKRILYITSEHFVNEYLNDLANKEIYKFRQRYRNVDVLLIDDVQFFSGKESCQNEFFHTFNDLFLLQKQIVLSCDKPINEVPKLEQRLITRFEWGLSIDIQPPDYETRLNILRKKAEVLGVQVSPAILDLIAHRITKNVRRLEGALNKVIGYTKLMGSLNLEEAQKLLNPMFVQEDGQSQIGIDAIQAKVAEMYHISVDDMKSRRRPAKIAVPRQIAMYISKKLTTMTLEEIGQAFGGRDHGTVMYAQKAVDDAMENDENLKRSVEYLLKMLSF